MTALGTLRGHSYRLDRAYSLARSREEEPPAQPIPPKPLPDDWRQYDEICIIGFQESYAEQTQNDSDDSFDRGLSVHLCGSSQPPTFANQMLADTASSVRIISRTKMGFAYPLPEAYKPKIATIPHVVAVAALVIYGGIYMRSAISFQA